GFAQDRATLPYDTASLCSPIHQQTPMEKACKERAIGLDGDALVYGQAARRSRTRAGTVCDRVDWHTKCRRADEALISSSAVMVQADTTRMRIPPWI
ncbi:hypothetical protein GW17_00060731, partial [Ensete ventricosum]